MTNPAEEAGLSSFQYTQGVPCLILMPTIIMQFPSQKVMKISVPGLIDAMGVLPVALFITVLFYSTNQL